MDTNIMSINIDEVYENTKLFSRRMECILKLVMSEKTDIHTKKVLIDFVFEIVKNIETDIYNIKMNL